MKGASLAGFITVAAALALGLAVVLWGWGLPLANDGATHVFQAYVHNHYRDASLGYDRFYDLLYPPTSCGFSDVQRILEPLLGWQAAWRVNVVLACELWALGFLAFVCAVSRRRAIAGLLGFPLALQAALWLGLLPFVYATAFGWLSLALWLWRSPSWPAAFGVLVLMTAAARCHIVPAALVGAILIVVALAHTPRGGKLRALFKLALAGTPALWIAIQVTASTALVGAAPEWPDAIDRLLVVGTWFQSGPRWRQVFATLLVLAGCASMLVGASQRKLTRAEAALAIVALVILTWTAALPEHLGTWQLGGMRALPLGAGIALAFLPVDRPGVRSAAAAATLLYAVVSLGWAFSLHRELRAEIEPALAGLSLPVHPVDRAAVLMPEPLPPHLVPVSGFDPFIHLANLYSLARGGMDPYGHHGLATVHHLRVKPSFARRGPPLDQAAAVGKLEGQARRVPTRVLLEMAEDFSELVMLGREEDFDVAVEAGFEPDVRAEPLLVARFRGCDGRLDLVGADVALDVELGWWPRRAPARLEHFRPGQGADPTLQLLRFSCGDVWVSVRGPRGARCAEGGAGPSRAVFSREGENLLRCTVVLDVEPGGAAEPPADDRSKE